jgi:serine protease Do
VRQAADPELRCYFKSRAQRGLRVAHVIRQTLEQTKDATYSILFPSQANQGMPAAHGTGFFIDPSGYFLTARHVIDGQSVPDAWLMQSHEAGGFAPMLQNPELVDEWAEYDLALLRVDFGKNATKAHLVDRSDFSYVPVHLDPVEEGSPAYAFGYPLPINQPVPTPPGSGMLIGHVGLGPRTTSAIVSSSLERTRMVQTGQDAQVYVLDKALNYGNSGGPILLEETGRAFAVCSRFQPVAIPQPNGTAVMIPSLYGVVTSISNIASDLRRQLPSLN